MRLDMMLSEQRTQLTLTLVMDGTQLGHIILETPEVEDVIHKIAAARASMAERVPPEIDPGSRLFAVDDPMWRTKVPSSAPKPGVVLALRHPGLGWIANLLPPAETRALGQSLLDLSREL